MPAPGTHPRWNEGQNVLQVSLHTSQFKTLCVFPSTLGACRLTVRITFASEKVYPSNHAVCTPRSHGWNQEGSQKLFMETPVCPGSKSESPWPTCISHLCSLRTSYLSHCLCFWLLFVHLPQLSLSHACNTYGWIINRNTQHQITCLYFLPTLNAWKAKYTNACTHIGVHNLFFFHKKTCRFCYLVNLISVSVKSQSASPALAAEVEREVPALRDLLPAAWAPQALSGRRSHPASLVPSSSLGAQVEIGLPPYGVVSILISKSWALINCYIILLSP